MTTFWIILAVLIIISLLIFYKLETHQKGGKAIYKIIEYVLPKDAPELEILEIINWERMKLNLFPIKIDVKTSKLAKKRVLEMIGAKVLSHNLMDDERQELIELGADFVGENIAIGYKNINALMTAFMNSEGHRKNILSRNYDWCGIAIDSDIDSQNYYCILFGGDEEYNQ